MLLCDAHGLIVACNDAACRLMQRHASELRGTACRDHVQQPPAADGDAALRNGEATVHRDDGNVPIELHFAPLAGAAGAREPDWLVRLRDLSDRREAQDRLVQLANFDSLTGLPNRALFRSRLERAMQRAQRSGRAMALMFLDLDRFKVINDSLGHEAGDRLLQQVAGVLTASLRGTDSVARLGEDSGYTVSRLGGDEFTVIAENVGDAGDAALVAQRLLDALAVPIAIGAEEVVVSASIGISMYPEGVVDLERLLRQTDMAMYRAKSLGRGVYCFFSEDLNAAVSARLSLESALRRAAERHEFELYYQPKARLADGHITGVEALLRWHSPGRGMVSPDRFIGVLEDTGLVLPVGAWVIRTACAQLAAWDSIGLPRLRMAINLSARQVRHAHLASLVEDTLREYGIEPARLDIELTESMLMEDSEATRALLADFARIGVRIALDDFGTGHSSLSYLKRFNVNTLKVDRSFVSALPDSGEDRAIAQAVIVMARSLAMTTVAEGVETAAQLQALGEMGCDEVQGYLIGRPLPAGDFAPWLAERVHRENLRRLSLTAAGAIPTMERIDIELEAAAPPGATVAAIAGGAHRAGQGSEPGARAGPQERRQDRLEHGEGEAGAAPKAVTVWTVGRSLESPDAREHRAEPAPSEHAAGAGDGGHERLAAAVAARPEPGATGRGDAAGAAGVDPRGRRLGQDARADHAHRLALADGPHDAGAGAGGDVHEQGGQGDARPPGGDAAGERARHVDRHLPRPGQPLPARALEAGGPAAVVPDPGRAGQRRRRQARRQGTQPR
ncbi:MAG: EAL domain-containing protein [Rubrivivax sp.]|nr:EAL domain-containing protein [Rubrivivax sp.]